DDWPRTLSHFVSQISRRLGLTHTAAMLRPSNTRQLRMFDADHGGCPATVSTTQPMDCVDASIVHRKRKEGTDASVTTMGPACCWGCRTDRYEDQHSRHRRSHDQ